MATIQVWDALDRDPGPEISDDTLYAALATVLELPMLIADVKLASARRGLSSEVELVG